MRSPQQAAEFLDAKAIRPQRKRKQTFLAAVARSFRGSAGAQGPRATAHALRLGKGSGAAVRRGGPDLTPANYFVASLTLSAISILETSKVFLPSFSLTVPVIVTLLGVLQIFLCHSLSALPAR